MSRPEASKPATLARGVVEMSLRGAPEDVERVRKALQAARFGAWSADSAATRAGNDAGYRYFSIKVPQVSDG